MDLEDTKKTITDSKFQEPLKQRLLATLPSLPANSLFGLEKEVGRGDGVLIERIITDLWEKYAKIAVNISKNQQQAKKDFWELFDYYNNITNDDDKLLFLYFVLDMRAMGWQNKSLFAQEDFTRILNFELDLLPYLPREEVAFFLGNFITLIGTKWDLFRGIQMSVWMNVYDYDFDFLKSCSDLLLKNKERLGLAKPLPVGEWVKQFISYSSTPVAKRGTFQVTDFLVKSPTVATLTKEEKNFLGEVLKLFLWFFNPDLNEDELFEYKKQIEAEKAKYYAELYEKEMGLSAGGSVTAETPSFASSAASIKTQPVVMQEVVPPLQPKVLPPVIPAKTQSKPVAPILPPAPKAAKPIVEPMPDKPKVELPKIVLPNLSPESKVTQENLAEIIKRQVMKNALAHESTSHAADLALSPAVAKSSTDDHVKETVLEVKKELVVPAPPKMPKPLSEEAKKNALNLQNVLKKSQQDQNGWRAGLKLGFGQIKSQPPKTPEIIQPAPEKKPENKTPKLEPVAPPVKIPNEPLKIDPQSESQYIDEKLDDLKKRTGNAKIAK